MLKHGLIKSGTPSWDSLDWREEGCEKEIRFGTISRDSLDWWEEGCEKEMRSGTNSRDSLGWYRVYACMIILERFTK